MQYTHLSRAFSSWPSLTKALQNLLVTWTSVGSAIGCEVDTFTDYIVTPHKMSIPSWSNHHHLIVSRQSPLVAMRQGKAFDTHLRRPRCAASDELFNRKLRSQTCDYTAPIVGNYLMPMLVNSHSKSCLCLVLEQAHTVCHQKLCHWPVVKQCSYSFQC